MSTRCWFGAEVGVRNHRGKLPANILDTACPDDVAALAARSAGSEDREEHTKRKRFEPWMSRREYLHGWRCWTVRKCRREITKWEMRKLRRLTNASA